MKDDGGVILINVLVVLALGAAIVVLMFTSQEDLTDRTRRAAAMTRAEALALGAETSMVVALRHDMLSAPDSDHMQEPWALATQQEVVLVTGRFEITVSDARSRFDLNVLATGRLAPQQIFGRLAQAIGLPDGVVADVLAHLIRYGPIQDLSEITALEAGERAALSGVVSLLPTRGTINVNTASERIIGAVVGSPGAARQLVRQRDRTGFLTRADLTEAGVIAMNGIGFTSDVFDVQTLAEVDGVVLTLTSRLMRAARLGRKSVSVVSRQFGDGSKEDSLGVPSPPTP